MSLVSSLREKLAVDSDGVRVQLCGHVSAIGWRLDGHLLLPLVKVPMSIGVDMECSLNMLHSRETTITAFDSKGS